MRKVETRFHSPHAKGVITAFTSASAMQAWWDAHSGLVEPRVGGMWAAAWEQNKYVATGRIAALEPGRLLRIVDYLYINYQRGIFGPMTLTVSVDGNEITILQEGYRDGPEWAWYYDAVRQSWPRVAPVLKRYLEKGK
jgi:hypothetical protein